MMCLILVILELYLVFLQLLLVWHLLVLFLIYFFQKNHYSEIASIVGTALTVSGISTGYYFTVFNSNVGASVTSLYQDGTVVGIGTSFLDNVYEVAQVSIAQTMGIGIGLTYVAQVTVSVQDYNGLTGLGYSEFFGEYSWGRIQTSPRASARIFTSYAGDQ